MMRYFFIVFLFFLAVSCSKVRNYREVAIKIDSAFSMMSDCNTDYIIISTEDFDRIEMPEYNDKIKDIKYIGLVSGDPLSTIYQLMVFDEKIYLLDNIIEKVFIFGSDGKIIKIINDKGGGPQEYIGLGTMCVSRIDSCLIVSDRLSMHLLYYSLDGRFIKKERSIASCFIESYGDKIINQLDFAQSFSQDLNSNFHIVSSVADSVHRKAFPLYPIHRNAVVYNSLSYNSMGDLLCTPLFSDTVYQIINDSVYSPKYVIQQKKSLWNKKHEPLTVKEQFDLVRDDNYTCLGKPFLETDNFIAYRIQVSSGDVPLFAFNQYFYDKVKKQSFYFAPEQAPKTVPNYIPHTGTSYNNYFVGYISQNMIASVREWKKTHELYIENEEFSNLIDSDTDWEAIIVMYELK